MSEPGELPPPKPTDDEDTVSENSADLRLKSSVAAGSEEKGEIVDTAAPATNMAVGIGNVATSKVEEVEQAEPFPPPIQPKPEVTTTTATTTEIPAAAELAVDDSAHQPPAENQEVVPPPVEKPAADTTTPMKTESTKTEEMEGEMEAPETKPKLEEKPSAAFQEEDGEVTEEPFLPNQPVAAAGQEETTKPSNDHDWVMVEKTGSEPVPETKQEEESKEQERTKEEISKDAPKEVEEAKKDEPVKTDEAPKPQAAEAPMELDDLEKMEESKEQGEMALAPQEDTAEQELAAAADPAETKEEDKAGEKGEVADMEMDDEPSSKPSNDSDERKEVEMANEETDEEGEIKEETEEELKESGPEDTDEEGEIKEAAEETEEEGDVRDTTATDEDMDESQSEMGADAAAEAAVEATIKKTEAAYSTRGRSASGTSTPVPTRDSKDSGGSGTEQWERSVREALEDLGRSKEGTTATGAGGVSFLEALGEEERRCRTRHLPAVDGIHMLRKNEIKGDMSLARSVRSNAGNVTTVSAFAAAAAVASSSKKSSKTKKKPQEGSTTGQPEEMDEDDASQPSDDGAYSDVGLRTGNTATIELNPRDVLSVPSTSFVPPPEAAQVSPDTNGEKDDDAPVIPSSTSVKALLNNQSTVKSPTVVESVTAFNPPRPPESMGAKKKHRMLRWERRPADVEVDLSNYRKTVQRTREELHTAEFELERIETVSAHLRRHFLGHLRCMDEENDQISIEMGTVQQECVAASDLLTSRTRSRGAGKGSYVMRDVLGVLKARGAELKDKGLSLQSAVVASDGTTSLNPGLGGVGAIGFTDWNQSTAISPQRIASSWTLPGDLVTTPYGDGTVMKIYDLLEGEAGKEAAGDKMDVDSPSKVSSSSAKAGASSKKKAPGSSTHEKETLVSARICVQLPFGVAYFSPSVVKSKELPNALSDARLVKRWRQIAETAVAVSGHLDAEGMTNVLPSDVPTKNDSEDEESANGPAAMETDEANTGLGRAGTNIDADDLDPSKRRFLPFGSSLFPTGSGRGDVLGNLGILELETALQPALSDGTGVLGDRTNQGIPMTARVAEDQRQQSHTLQARVYHLRNQLYRQRRIRTLNERTYQATRDRSSRVEGLVTEMRADLRSLKNRLEEELSELGIDQTRAQEILKAYYASQEQEEYEDDEAYADDLSPSSKRRRGGSFDKGAIDDNQAGGAEARADDAEPESKRVKVSYQ